MHDFEKLGAFYLGREFDLDANEAREDLLLYDSKDLTTHAVCVGMTGSGKTGLCLSLLEEAAIDGIPAIAVDPKGDLGNLCLTFPKLEPADFRPWIDESAATREGLTPDQYAAETAERWRRGLADWGQDPERIAKFREAVDLAIYTPGSNAGLPLTVLRSFAAPPPELVDDSDAFRDRVGSAASGLLALLGIDADPIRSRPHILISTILARAWSEGRNLDVAGLIREIQSPPFDKVGILDLDSFFPQKDRIDLSLSLNNLLASPSFAGWMEGEPLDVKRLLYTESGKPRLSIISIAHLSDAERMFFVTILLGEVLAWVRTQAGTSSLRALLYMDEVFGYFPPTANPPSKTPMLTLLKQARAYGLGVVLATQNPVDLDYKGLSNTGTWFLGRLQTERDKMRVLEGLEGASAEAGSAFDRQRMESILAGLGKRVFLMNNVHEDEPVAFQTRWALSYLRGPLTRQHILKLMAARKEEHEDAPPEVEAPETPAPPADAATVAPVDQPRPPIVSPDIDMRFLRPQRQAAEGNRLIYRPALLGAGRLHFVRVTYHVDVWQPRAQLVTIGDEVPHRLWKSADQVELKQLEFDEKPDPGAGFAPLPAELCKAGSYATWGKRLIDFWYRSDSVTVLRCAELKQYSQAGETEGDFRARLAHLANEERDRKVEKLRKKYATRFSRIKERIQSAEARVAREKAQYHQASLQTAVSFGSSILGALFGRKLASRTNVSKASTSVRSLGRAAQQRGDIGPAQAKLQDYIEKKEELEHEFEDEIDEIETKYNVEAFDLEKLSVRPRKSDTEVDFVALVWAPWQADADGVATPLFELRDLAGTA